MKAVIGRWYKTYKDARAYADRQEKMWSKRVKFYVVSDSKGNLVISESAARKIFPDLFPKRVFGNRNECKIIV